MGLKSWWTDQRRQVALTRKTLEIENNQEVIAQQVPELAGKSDVERMAYILEQIDEWKRECTAEQAVALAGRLQASQESWKNDGLTMPTWGNLWVLRNYQRELGMDVPEVALPVGSDQHPNI